MNHTTLLLAAVTGLGSFLGAFVDPTTVFGTAFVLTALVVLFTSARQAMHVDLPLPSAAAAVMSFLLLLVVFLGPFWLH